MGNDNHNVNDDGNYKNERKEKEILSGDDIEDQDDFEAWQRFCQ